MALFSYENFKRNVGGASGGLMALGDFLSAAAAGSASRQPGESAVSAVGRGVAAGAAGLRKSFEIGRQQQQQREFREFAGEKLKDPNVAGKQRQLWEAALYGNPEYTKLLPSLWYAEAADANAAAKAAAARSAAATAGMPTSAQQATNETIIRDRQELARLHHAMRGDPNNPQWKELLSEENGVYSAMTKSARRALVGVPDPEGPYWHRLSATNPMFPSDAPLPPVDPRTGMYSFAGGFENQPPPADDAAVPTTEGEGKGLFSGAADAVKGWLGLGGADPESPEAQLEAIMGAADASRAEASAASGAAPAIGQAQPRVLPPPEVLEAEARARRGQPVTFGERMSQIGSGLYTFSNRFVPEETRMSADENRQFNSIMGRLDPFWGVQTPIEAWMDSPSSVPRDPYYDAGRKAREDLRRGLFGQ